MNKTDEFKKAEALGQIKTMPAEKELPAPVEPEPIEIVNDPASFAAAIGNAQMEDIDSIEVGEKLFKHLMRNSKAKYLTYGNPGIKVYLAGTRDQIEREENMSAEAYGDMMARRKMNV